MCAMYPLSHANQLHSSYAYFNTGFAMKVMHPRNRSTESVSEAICARERAGRDGESASEETKEGPDTARRAPMRHTVERTETIDDKSGTYNSENTQFQSRYGVYARLLVATIDATTQAGVVLAADDEQKLQEMPNGDG